MRAVRSRNQFRAAYRTVARVVWRQEYRQEKQRHLSSCSANTDAASSRLPILSRSMLCSSSSPSNAESSAWSFGVPPRRCSTSLALSEKNRCACRAHCSMFRSGDAWHLQSHQLSGEGEPHNFNPPEVGVAWLQMASATSAHWSGRSAAMLAARILQGFYGVACGRGLNRCLPTRILRDSLGTPRLAVATCHTLCHVPDPCCPLLSIWFVAGRHSNRVGRYRGGTVSKRPGKSV